MFSPIYDHRLLINLHPDPNGFRYEGWGGTVDVGLDQIERIEAYKHERMAEDLVCLDIWMDRTASTRGPVTITEGMKGFDIVIEGLERMRGFDTAWRDKVMLAFAENRAVVYERS